MRCFDNGCFYTVTFTASDVMEFARRWPCSNLRSRSVFFQFDKRNGDLVDTDSDTKQPAADQGAILAMSQDAQAYGRRRFATDKK
jgi:hypothetical protein